MTNMDDIREAVREAFGVWIKDEIRRGQIPDLVLAQRADMAERFINEFDIHVYLAIRAKRLADGRTREMSAAEVAEAAANDAAATAEATKGGRP